MRLYAKKEFKDWLKTRSRRTKDGVFIFLLIVAYIMSVGIMNAENMLQYAIGAVIALFAIYLAILVYETLKKNNSHGEPNQRRSIL
ncbi:MAG: hypothetical protein WA063_06950 [Minisyncoccia bacterium]